MRRLLSTQRLYTDFSILVNFFNEIYQNWLYGLESFAVVAVTINATIAILYFHPRGIIAATVSFHLLLHCVKASGSVYEESRKSLECWRKMDHKSKCFAKYSRSCRPLRIRFGRFFYSDKTLLLTVISTILTQTANLVVTFSPQ